MLARTLTLLLLSCCACAGPKALPVDHATWETAGGVIVHELFAGLGERAGAGQRIALEYTSWLEDGSEIDSSADWGSAVIFELGAAPLPGWDEGLEGIAVGGRRRLIVPPAMAYGSEGIPGTVPPNAVLIFEVERVALTETLAEPEPARPEPARPEPAQSGSAQSGSAQSAPESELGGDEGASG